MAARVDLAGEAEPNVATGLPVLDHVLSLAARQGRFGLALEVPPDAGGAEVVAAAHALGAAFAPLVEGKHASEIAVAEEALAHVALEATGRPLVVSNVDLSDERVGGLGGDPAATFVEELAAAAGLTLHVRLVEGRDTQHVLEAIFKALGAALAKAARSA